MSFGLAAKMKAQAVQQARKTNPNPLPAAIRGHIILLASRGELKLDNQAQVEAHLKMLYKGFEIQGLSASLFNPNSKWGKADNVVSEMQDFAHKLTRRR